MSGRYGAGRRRPPYGRTLTAMGTILLAASLPEPLQAAEDGAIYWSGPAWFPADARRQPLILTQAEPVAPEPVAPEEPEPVAPEEPEAAPARPAPAPARPAPARPAPAPAQRPPAPAQPTPAAEPERPRSEKPQEQLLVEVGGVLLPAGTLQIEPSLDYSRISRDRVAINGFTVFDAIVIGTIQVDNLERDILTAAVNARYGITNRLQADLHVPYVYRHDSEILQAGTDQATERDIEGNNIGDIEAGISWQATNGRGGFPATVVRVRGRFPTGESAFDIPQEQVGAGSELRLQRSPTGSGFYGVGPSATFLWRADPAVLFAGGGYTFNLERDQGAQFGEVDPGDTIEWFAGVNLALSEQIALNLSFRNQLTGTTQQNGVEALGSDSNDARLSLGTSIGLGATRTLVVTTAAGLTDEAPDFSFTVSLPINFSLF